MGKQCQTVGADSGVSKEGKKTIVEAEVEAWGPSLGPKQP